MDNWYDKYIEPEVRDLVKYLRDNGVNTECSCGHEMYIQCQYSVDGFIQDLHCLLFDYFYKQKKEINYEINVYHKVIEGHSYTDLEIKLPKEKENEKREDKKENVKLRSKRRVSKKV